MNKPNGKTLCVNIVKIFFNFICAFISTIMCLGSILGTVIILNTASFVSGKTITIIILIILISIFLFSAILCWKKLFYLIIEIKKQYHPITRKNLTEATTYSAISNTNPVPSNMPIQKITFRSPQIFTDTEAPNVKFHRTEHEEELSFNFEKRFGYEILILEEKFESLYQNACQSDSLDIRIDLLYEAAEAFEKAKNFCYSKGKGGTIYFQDMWEYLHNANRPSYSYMDIITDALENAKYEKMLEATDALQAAHNSEIQDTFTSTAKNMIINEELPYKTKQNGVIPNWQINGLIRVIQESYQIISETENPETLCSRYEFALSKVEELSLYYRQNLYTDSATLNQCTEMYSVENYAKLITQCYYKYLDKARRELKTQKGIEKRIDKYWNIIQNNVDTNLYLQLRRQLT